MRPEYLSKYVIAVLPLMLVIFAASASAQFTYSYNPVSPVSSPTTVNFVAGCTGGCSVSTSSNPPAGLEIDVEIMSPGNTCPSTPQYYGTSCGGSIGSATPPCDIANSGTGSLPTTPPPTEAFYDDSSTPDTYAICWYYFSSSNAWTLASSSGQYDSLTVQCTSGTCTGGPSTNSNPAIAAICNVYTFVNVIVFILALTLMILGGALYAGAQILPGQARGQVQGYAMGLILGGVAGAIIAMLAPYVLSIAYGTPVNTIAICYAPPT